MSDIFARRCARLLRAAKKVAACRAVLVSRRENVRYLTGFTGEDSWLIVSPRRRTLLWENLLVIRLRHRYSRADVFLGGNTPESMRRSLPLARKR